VKCFGPRHCTSESTVGSKEPLPLLIHWNQQPRFYPKTSYVPNAVRPHMPVSLVHHETFAWLIRDRYGFQALVTDLGTGYLQQSFSIHCNSSECQFEITKEGLAVLKITQDLVRPKWTPQEHIAYVLSIPSRFDRLIFLPKRNIIHPNQWPRR